MSFISAAAPDAAQSPEQPSPQPLVFALEADAEQVLAKLSATRAEADTARHEALDFLQALERAHLRVADQLSISSPFKAAPPVPTPAAPPAPSLSPAAA